jgi:hypothetical protein
LRAPLKCALNENNISLHKSPEQKSDANLIIKNIFWIPFLFRALLHGYKKRRILLLILNLLKSKKFYPKKDRGREILHTVLKDEKPHNSFSFMLIINFVETSSQSFNVFEASTSVFDTQEDIFLGWGPGKF